ncbi:MAG: hypothetical protein QXG69_07300 [Candidatus Caldarchaeum sp.]
MRLRSPVTSAALTLSVIFSAVLLLTDAELWASAPHHGYGLAGLAIADMAILTVLQTGRIASPRKIVMVWGLAKFVVFLGDVLTAPEFGITYGEFASYLFSLWAYDGLLISQILIIAGPYLDRLWAGK